MDRSPEPGDVVDMADPLDQTLVDPGPNLRLAVRIRTLGIDAAGNALLRKKLRGVVQFLRECGELAKFPYDFNRLTNKLGLDGAAMASVQAIIDGIEP